MLLPNLKEKQINLILFSLFFILLVINLIFISLWLNLKKKQRLIQSPLITKQVERDRLPQKETQLLSSEDYIVKSINGNTQVDLQGNSGKRTILNNSKLHVFFAGPSGGIPASFYDLKTGQRVRVKSFSERDETWIYIIR